MVQVQSPRPTSLEGVEILKSLIVSDSHFGEYHHGFIDPKSGFNSRLLDIYDVFSSVADYARKNDIKHIFIAGDVYDQKNPKNYIRYMFGSIVAKLLLSNINVYILTGNHDQTSSKIGSNALSELKAISKVLSNLIVIDKPTLKTIDNIQFILFPRVNRSEIQGDVKSYIETELTHFCDSLQDQYTFLIGHFSTDKTQLGPEEQDEYVIALDVLKSLPIDFTILGHIHRMQKLTPTIYHVGSMVRTDFNEENEQKYFFVLNHNEYKVKFIKIQDREFKTLSIDLTTDVTRFDQFFEQIKVMNLSDCITRLCIRYNESDDDGLPLTELIDYLTKNSWKYTGIIRDIVRTTQSRQSEITEQFSAKEAFLTYINENKEYFGDYTSECLSEGQKILNSVRG